VEERNRLCKTARERERERKEQIRFQDEREREKNRSGLKISNWQELRGFTSV
jgi:hypothetical protein